MMVVCTVTTYQVSVGCITEILMLTSRMEYTYFAHYEGLTIILLGKIFPFGTAPTMTTDKK